MLANTTISLTDILRDIEPFVYGSSHEMGAWLAGKSVGPPEN